MSDCPNCGWSSCHCSRYDLERYERDHRYELPYDTERDLNHRIDEMRWEETREEQRREEEAAEERAAHRRAEERRYEEECERAYYEQQQPYPDEPYPDQPTPCDENEHAPLDEIGRCWCGALYYDREGNPIDETSDKPAAQKEAR